MIRESIRLLAEQCDWARALDRVGFSASDTGFGHELSTLPDEAWTPGLLRAAWELIQKYHRQLAAHGVDVAAIPAPDPVPGEAEWRQERLRLLGIRRERHRQEREEAQAQARAENLAARRRIDAHPRGGGFEVRFPPQPPDLDRLRAFPRRHFVGEVRAWMVPAVPANRASLLALLDEAGFVAGDGVREQIEAIPLIENAPQIEEDTRGQIGFYGEYVTFEFPRNPEVEARIRACPGGHFNRHPSARWLARKGIHTAALALSLVRESGWTVEADVLTSLEETVTRHRELAEAGRISQADFQVDGLSRALTPEEGAAAAFALIAGNAVLPGTFGSPYGAVSALASAQAAGARPIIILSAAQECDAWHELVREILRDRMLTVQTFKTAGPFVEGRDVIICSERAWVRMAPEFIFRPCGAFIMGAPHRVADSRQQFSELTRRMCEGSMLSTVVGGSTLEAPGWAGVLSLFGKLEMVGGYQRFVRLYHREDQAGIEERCDVMGAAGVFTAPWAPPRLQQEDRVPEMPAPEQPGIAGDEDRTERRLQTARRFRLL